MGLFTKFFAQVVFFTLDTRLMALITAYCINVREYSFLVSHISPYTVENRSVKTRNLAYFMLWLVECFNKLSQIFDITNRCILDYFNPFRVNVSIYFNAF